MSDTNTEKGDQENHDLLLLMLWKLLRNTETSQGVPRFAGFLASIYAEKDVAPTKMTHLPLIHTAIKYWTLAEILEISHKLAKQGNIHEYHIRRSCSYQSLSRDLERQRPME